MDDDWYSLQAINRLWDLLGMVNAEVVEIQSLIVEVQREVGEVSDQVAAVIGGSSQKIDQDMIDSLQHSIRRSELALDALDWVRTSIRRIG